MKYIALAIMLLMNTCAGFAFYDTTIENGTIVIWESDHLGGNGSVVLTVNSSDVEKIPANCPHAPIINTKPDADFIRSRTEFLRYLRESRIPLQ